MENIMATITPEFFLAIDRHRADRRVNLCRFAEELGIPYAQVWNTVHLRTIPHAHNLKPYRDYYERYRDEIDAIIEELEAERVADKYAATALDAE
jgi:hypothetical protein